MSHPGAIMKHDANSIVREHGVAHLRRVFDQSAMFVPSEQSPPDDWQPSADFQETSDAGQGMEPAPAGLPAKTQPLKLTYFDDCGAFVEKRSILKGIIARGESSAWIAPPGAGKSALLTEISVHCAAKIDWRGHKAKEACGVVILALERGDLFKRRLRVYNQRDGLQGLPIAVADAVIDLLNPGCVGLIVATVHEAEQQFGVGVGLIVIDTYAKGIAANGGDEDKARDQNRAAANLRNVHARLDVHIALVGHTGKDETRGARGSNAHVGDVDVMVQISGDGTKVAEVIKGNDQPERTLTQFRLEAFELGRDEDDDPITTSIVSTEAVEGSISKNRPPKKGPNDRQRLALAALAATILNHGKPPPTSFGLSAGISVAPIEDWRTEIIARGIVDKGGKNPRTDFARLKEALAAKGYIGERDDLVWSADKSL
jgi:hypothetical protein